MKQASQASLQLALSFWKWETVKPKENVNHTPNIYGPNCVFGIEGRTELLLHSRLLHP